MMRRCRGFSFLAAALLHAAILSAHTNEPDTTSSLTALCSLTLRSTPDSAYITLDGKPRGRTPLTIDQLPEGTHAIVVQHPALESWLASPVRDSLHLVAGEHRTVHFALTTRFLINSDPYDAEVRSGDSLLGQTPLIISASTPIISLRKEGYEPVALDLAGRDSAVIRTSLRPEWERQGSFPPPLPVIEVRRSPVRLYVTGAATVLSGVAAAYFKIKADDTYQQYLVTHNPSDLSRTRDLDTSAGIALVTTQLGLALFTYFIFTQ
jgi:hypothetical protein